MRRTRGRARSRKSARPDSLWAFLIWLGDHGWHEWRLVTSFVVVAGAVIALISAASAHLVTYLIALLR